MSYRRGHHLPGSYHSRHVFGKYRFSDSNYHLRMSSDLLYPEKVHGFHNSSARRKYTSGKRFSGLRNR